MGIADDGMDGIASTGTGMIGRTGLGHLHFFHPSFAEMGGADGIGGLGRLEPSFIWGNFEAGLGNLGATVDPVGQDWPIAPKKKGTNIQKGLTKVANILLIVAVSVLVVKGAATIAPDVEGLVGTGRRISK